MERKILCGILFIILCCAISIAGPDDHNKSKVIAIPVDFVPADFPVNFALYTVDTLQFVSYFDTSHQLIIAKRNINDRQWQYKPLDSKVGWDSHNYLSLAVDKNGLIHLAGNMHSSPLIYFRSQKPFDIQSMQPLHFMTAKEEDVVTYPEFMKGPHGEIVFHYRYGVSGSGYEIFNMWRADQKKWRRLLDQPLTDGQNKMNAYIQGPLAGPDGYFHLLWVWRDTPDCATNHTLSYARSKDLLNWESIRGEKISLPITIEDKESWVDATPVNGGLLNIGIKIGFDTDNKILPGYHKYDENGNTQLYLARFEDNAWNTYLISDWNYRWDFKGYGTIQNQLLIEAPRAALQNNEIIFGYHHIKYGDGQFVINNNTLETIRSEAFSASYPAKLDSVYSLQQGMQVNKVFDSSGMYPDKNFLLRWETLEPNRDQARETQLAVTLLQVIEY